MRCWARVCSLSLRVPGGWFNRYIPSKQQLLLRLQSAGLVSLEKDKNDLRRTLVRRTPAAEAFEQKYRESSVLFMDSLFEGISAEALAAARQVIHQLDQNLKSIANGINQKEDDV